jgi:2-polyprenyl-3-methyl-5-hydroxy-6-metoxy-1,4-benzoquinol methylase
MTMHEYPCDVCGAGDAAAIEVTSFYTKGDPIAVCRNCGFVYAHRRPSPAAIADAWATQVYSGKFDDGHYTARGIPAVRARHVYVAEFMHGTASLKDKETVDIGAGEGVFLQLLAEPEYGAKAFGIEMSEVNCRHMDGAGLACFKGSVEDYLASSSARLHGFDRACVVWTLENTSSASSMMKAARALLKDDGFLTVATSSRILVPFKKPLHYYLNPHVSAIHPFFFSANALRNLFTNAAFKVEDVNRFIDTDYLVMAGRALHEQAVSALVKDDWQDVIGFFERWHEETKNHYAGT